jgi:hypothetical protein
MRQQSNERVNITRNAHQRIPKKLIIVHRHCTNNSAREKELREKAGPAALAIQSARKSDWIESPHHDMAALFNIKIIKIYGISRIDYFHALSGALVLRLWIAGAPERRR